MYRTVGESDVNHVVWVLLWADGVCCNIRFVADTAGRGMWHRSPTKRLGLPRQSVAWGRAALSWFFFICAIGPTSDLTHELTVSIKQLISVKGLMVQFIRLTTVNNCAITTKWMKANFPNSGNLFMYRPKLVFLPFKENSLILVCLLVSCRMDVTVSSLGHHYRL